MKKGLQKIVLAGVILAFVAAPPLSAQALTPSQIQAQIADLIAQLNALRASLDAPAGTQAPQTPDVPLFTAPLRPGMQGDQVHNLQVFLSTLPGIYPEGITSGYYGPLTTQAVRRFQARYGIETVGIVGPQTRAQLNRVRTERLAENTSDGADTQAAPPVITVTDSTGVEHSVAVETDSLTPPDYNRFALARDVQVAINKERKKRGLQEVAWNETLALVARLHSQDQAADNEVITNADKPCTYPLLRHEGKTRGLTVLERTQTLFKDFRRVGENIVTFPISEKSVYGYQSSEGSVRCPRVDEYDHTDYDTPEERLRAFNRARDERIRALRDVREVTWVAREWKTTDEIVKKAVDLWMNSPGHRENVLRPEYDEAGVGIAVVNNYYIITQVFIQKRLSASAVFLETN